MRIHNCWLAPEHFEPELGDWIVLVSKEYGKWKPKLHRYNEFVKSVLRPDSYSYGMILATRNLEGGGEDWQPPERVEQPQVCLFCGKIEK